jgi:hypothetical protein
MQHEPRTDAPASQATANKSVFQRQWPLSRHPTWQIWARLHPITKQAVLGALAGEGGAGLPTCIRFSPNSPLIDPFYHFEARVYGKAGGIRSS